MYLVDTSVWINTFRRDDPFDLEEVVPYDSIVTCPPIVQEILQGFRDERAWRTARESLYSLAIVESPMSIAVFEEAANLFRAAKRAGFTIRSSVDCLIAACAIRNDLEVLHCDRDFSILAKVSNLRERD
ncbi:MAG: PIN domain-containing protein, partial [Planctomycetota bacterium]